MTPAQLAEALEHQRANGGELEDVLQYLFAIQPGVVAEVLGAYRRHEISVDIGSLLIAAGAVDEERLDEARRHSVETGQPLGPILVEMGAISRLELASALADQWSDSPAQILPPPGVADRFGVGASAGDMDDLRFAMRALEDSVRAERVAEAGDDALEQIQRREDALAARVAALEIAIEQPIEVDSELLHEIHETAQRLAALQSSLEHVARAEDVAALAGALGDLDELRIALERLEGRTADLPEPQALARVLDDIVALAERLDGVTASVDDVARRAELEALRETLEDLAARPVGDPELAARVAELGQSVEALAVVADAATGADGLREAIAGLGARIDAAAAAAARAEDDLATLRTTVAELAALPGRIEELSGVGLHVAELQESLAALASIAAELETVGSTAAQTAAELAGLRTAVDDLSSLPARVDELADSSRADELAELVQAIRSELDEVAGRPSGDPAVAERLEELADRVAALTGSMLSVEEVVGAFADVAGRVAAVEGVTADLASLREAIAELAASSAASDDLSLRVTQLADRVESLSIDALGPAAEAAVAGVAARVEELVAGQAGAAGRAEELRARVDELREEVAALRDRHESDTVTADGAGALEEALAALELRLEGTAPTSAVSSLAVAVEELRAAVAPLPALEGRVESVERRLTEAEARAGEAARATDGALEAVREHVEAVAEQTTAQLAAVLERLDRSEVGAPQTATADAGLRDEVAALGGVVESVRTTVDAELQRLERVWAAEREALAERIAAVSAGTESVARGGASSASSTPAVPASDLARVARDLERLSDRVVEQERSLVEHFARRERALLERLGLGNDVGQRLSELTRRLDELRARVDSGGSAGSGAGVGDEEIAALKESLVSRLERLASSIDWRFQRLEGGPAAAAGRTDLHTRVDQLTSMVELLTRQGRAGESDDGTVPGGFLALVPTGGGHQLLEMTGTAPEAGERVDDPLGSGEMVVVAVGSSPLPGDDRPCIFVEPVGEQDAPAAVAADAVAND